jgi:hypothetical protein
MAREEDGAGDEGRFDLGEWLTGEKVLVAVILLVGVAGTGVARYWLGAMGYNWAGRIVFVLGYGAMVGVLWYGWIRPLDLAGPAGRSEDASAPTDRGEE